MAGVETARNAITHARDRPPGRRWEPRRPEGARRGYLAKRCTWSTQWALPVSTASSPANA